MSLKSLLQKLAANMYILKNDGNIHISKTKAKVSRGMVFFLHYQLQLCISKYFQVFNQINPFNQSISVDPELNPKQGFVVPPR